MKLGVRRLAFPVNQNSAGLVGLVALLLAVPWLVRAFLPAFYLPLATEMLIMALFAFGFDVLMGYTGMISFGHAAFLGLGAYVTGLLMLRLGMPFLPAMLAGVFAATAAAALMAFFAIRLKSVYFALLTFAFAQLFYQAAIFLKDLTGGSDGSAISTPMQIGLTGLFELNLRDRTVDYYVVLVVVAFAFLLTRRVVRSAFGAVLVAIRENELRAATMGYNVARYKQAAFVFSGLLGGIAGALFVPYQRFISPELLYWEFSGLVIIMVLLGGKGTLWGPMVGAAVVVFLRDWLTGYTRHYLLLLGLIFTALVIFAPNGLAGILASRRAKAPHAEDSAPGPEGRAGTMLMDQE